MATTADETFGSLQFSFPVCQTSFQLLTVYDQSYHLCIPQLRTSSLQSPICQKKMSTLELVFWKLCVFVK